MQASSIPVSVLLLDDGELDPVDRALRSIGADIERLTGPGIAGRIQQPRDLLVTSWKRTLEMPTFDGVDGSNPPTWVCFHNQDFLPLRERLRGIGVNFLAHSSINVEALRLFLLQMLYVGNERRASTRLPLGADVFIRNGNKVTTARLLEVSSESCLILSTEPLRLKDSVTIVLPEMISGGGRCMLSCTPIRSSACQTRTKEIAYSTVLRFDELEAHARATLDAIARGEQIGTFVSPLAGAASGGPRAPDPPAATAANAIPLGDSPEATDAELERSRRGTSRHMYDRPVQLLGVADSDDHRPVVGRNLSLDGILVDGYRDLKPNDKVKLALYAGPREEPLVVTASVVRSDGSDDVAFRFEDLTANQKRGLQKLTVGDECIESIDRGGAVIMTKLVKGS